MDYEEMFKSAYERNKQANVRIGELLKEVDFLRKQNESLSNNYDCLLRRSYKQQQEDTHEDYVSDIMGGL